MSGFISFISYTREPEPEGDQQHPTINSLTVRPIEILAMNIPKKFCSVNKSICQIMEVVMID